MNEIKLTARIGKEPIIKEMNDKSVARFSIAIDTLNKTSNTTTSWMNCEMWRTKGNEIDFEVLRKGLLIDIEGFFKSEEWVDKESSEKKSRTIIGVKQATITQRKEKTK